MVHHRRIGEGEQIANRTTTSRHRAGVVVAAVVMALVGHKALAAPAKTQSPTSGPCHVEAGHGYLRGGVVDDASTAQRLADAVIDEEYRRDRKRFGQVKIDDRGRYWDVLLRARKNQYGGTLYFQIDKCTGAMSHFEFQE